LARHHGSSIDGLKYIEKLVNRLKKKKEKINRKMEKIYTYFTLAE